MVDSGMSRMIDDYITKEPDDYTHEQEEAYDFGWAYAEDHPEYEHVNDNPYDEGTEPLLYDAWSDGFNDCIEEIER